MEALSQAIRGYCASHPEAQFSSVADEFCVTEGTVLAALEGEIASRLTNFDLFELAQELSTWGKLRLVIRNRAALSEMLGTLQGVRLSKGWLSVENDHFHLHLKAEEIRQIYLVRKAAPPARVSYSVQFLDGTGAVVLKAFLLETADGSGQVERFDGLMRR